MVSNARIYFKIIILPPKLNSFRQAVGSFFCRIRHDCVCLLSSLPGKWTTYFSADQYCPLMITDTIRLFQEYDYISCKRLAYFYSSKPQPHHFTVLVRGIPRDRTGSLSGSVDRFFSEIYSYAYLRHIMVRQTSKLRRLIV